jgi:hypothetical protein
MRNEVAYLKEFLKNPSGSMTVEFVTFAPLLIAALVVSFEFGRAFWAYDVMTRDVRAAARYLARDPSAIPPYANSDCPDPVRYIAQTGSPKASDFTDANKHFPWKGAAPTFTCPVARTINPANFNNAGNVVRVQASVPVTLSLLQVLNRLSGLLSTQADQQTPASVAVSYPLTVSYEVRYMGN